MILFLDFDGVLHPARAVMGQRSPELVGDGSLFMWAELLAERPHVQIVLSTSWARHLPLEQVRDFLPVALRRRVVTVTGADWADAASQALADAGHNPRIDHRSLAAQCPPGSAGAPRVLDERHDQVRQLDQRAQQRRDTQYLHDLQQQLAQTRPGDGINCQRQAELDCARDLQARGQQRRHWKQPRLDDLTRRQARLQHSQAHSAAAADARLRREQPGCPKPGPNASGNTSSNRNRPGSRTPGTTSRHWPGNGPTRPPAMATGAAAGSACPPPCARPSKPTTSSLQAIPGGKSSWRGMGI